ncbi:MAG: hypothetical protein CMJ76_00995 [Planctomycetaceae bacterium]|mgnify:CR=1 FL=1|nr:hypothetical protein [Planctomycetaceae bacterium]|tara:strand:- start:801 stop:2411 length:1611 start_codon:yes stop_codon:yes gene_type:complete
MSDKIRYFQFALLLGVLGIGCLVLSGCGDEAPSYPKAGEASSFGQKTTLIDEQTDTAKQGKSGSQTDLPGDNVAAIQPATLFAGWENPKDVIVFTGRQFGYIEPCGCTGLERQKGGLARRHSFIRGLQENGWNVVSLDTGNQVRRFGRQPELKFNLTSELLGTMEYRAVGLGPDDLKLPAGELFAVAAVDDQNESMFVSSNVAILDRDFTRRFQLIETDHQKIAVASIIQDDWLTSLFNDDLIIENTASALKVVAADELFQQASLKILVIHGTLDYVRELAKSHEEYDLLVCAGVPGEPAYELEEVKGAKPKLLKVGEKSMFASVVGVFDSESGKPVMKYQRVPLDASYTDSAEVLAMFKQYQEELQRAGFSGLGIQPESHVSGYRFVGSKTCADCHQEEFEIWENSSHAYATQSLIAPHGRAEIPRQFDPECISCHSTGWQTQKYVPYESGFMSLADTLNLQGNGCENCHGPGSEHVRQESDPNSTMDSLTQLRNFLHRDLEDAKTSCLGCHDLDNSPDFHHDGAFEEYWSKIRH